MNRLRAVERCNGPARRRIVGGGLHICFPSDNNAVFFFGEKKRRRLGQRTSSVRSRCVTSNEYVIDKQPNTNERDAPSRSTPVGSKILLLEPPANEGHNILTQKNGKTQTTVNT